jgi:hypothetical protein
VFPAPNDVLTNAGVLTHWISLDDALSNSGSQQSETVAETVANRSSATPDELVEAQGWIRDRSGAIVLVAQVPKAPAIAGWQLGCDRSH